MSKLNALAARCMGAVDGPRISLAQDHTWQFPDGAIYRKRQWDPTTNLNHAMQLVEKLRGEGWAFQSHSDWDGVGWAEAAQKPGNRVAFGRDDSRPLAITLCCLRASGVPESEIKAAMEGERDGG